MRETFQTKGTERFCEKRLVGTCLYAWWLSLQRTKKRKNPREMEWPDHRSENRVGKGLLVKIKDENNLPSLAITSGEALKDSKGQVTFCKVQKTQKTRPKEASYETTGKDRERWPAITTK